MNSPPRLSIVMALWNSQKWIPACFEALEQQSNQQFECIVVDNGSKDEGPTWIEENYSNAKLLRLEKNTGFAHAMNLGIQNSSAPYILTLNVDTVPQSDFVEILLSKIASEPDTTGLLATCMLDYNNPTKIENAGDLLTWNGEALKRGHDNPAEDYQTTEYIFSACAGAALYRRSMLDDIGDFDETFFAYLEDIDIGLRAKIRGYKCLYEPTAKVLHRGHGSNLPGALYIQWVTRNRIQLFFKNLPGNLLLKKAPQLLWGQFVCLCVYRRHPLAWLKGMLEGVCSIPRCRKYARSLWRNHASITARDIENEISTIPILRRSSNR